MKIGDAVAWGARDNSYGTLQVASSVCATEVRFVYVSGYVSCNTGTGRRIGCGLQTAIFGCSRGNRGGVCVHVGVVATAVMFADVPTPSHIYAVAWC